MDSILDTLYETAENGVIMNIFKSRISHSLDGKTDSTFVRSLQSREFLSDIIEYDSVNNVIRKMFISFNAKTGIADRDTEFTTTKYRGNIFEKEVYTKILNQSESKNDSIAYTFRADGKLERISKIVV